ncbi:MAG: polysaccharide biosynthesis C-terminal domain-containing protein [Terriglobales bacterium]
MNSPGLEPSSASVDAGIFTLPISVFRRVWRDASWSLGGNLLTLLSGLATLKIVGSLVPAAEYGAASLVLGLTALLNQFIAGPILSERVRLYFDHLKRGDARPLARVLQGLLIRISVFMTAIYLVVAFVMNFRGQSTYLDIFVPVLILLFMQPQLASAFAQLEAHRNYRGLAFAQPLVAVLQVPVLLGLLWLTLRGATSIVMAQAVAATLVFLALAWRWRAHVSSDPSGLESALAQSSISNFGWSLYLFNLASWMMGMSDRYIIDYFATRSDVGIYVINYAFWAVPYTVLNGWIHSFSRPRLYARAADQAWDRVLRATMGALTAGVGLAITGTIVIYFVGKPLALWVLGERYWHSVTLMMLLAVAHIFFLIGHTVSAYFLALKTSHWVWISSLLAAVFGVAANIVLLPRWGIVGAAFVTLCAYAFWSVLMLGGMLVLSRRLASLGKPL